MANYGEVQLIYSNRLASFWCVEIRFGHGNLGFRMYFLKEKVFNWSDYKTDGDEVVKRKRGHHFLVPFAILLIT